MSTIDSYIIEHEADFLKYFKSKYPFFHLSNVFFRDLHYGVMSFLQQQKQETTYPEAENATEQIAKHLEGKNIFQRIDDRTWLLHYPEFKAIPKKKPVKAAKPAPAKPAAAKPAQASTAKPAAPAAAPDQKKGPAESPNAPEQPKPTAEKKDDASSPAS